VLGLVEKIVQAFGGLFAFQFHSGCELVRIDSFEFETSSQGVHAYDDDQFVDRVLDLFKDWRRATSDEVLPFQAQFIGPIPVVQYPAV